MGYIGLLLNAPYKIDSMMGCGCGYSLLRLSLLFFCLFDGLWEPGDKMSRGDLKGRYPGFKKV
jgi:hypothetical protein